MKHWMREFRALGLTLLVVGAFVPQARAQGARKDDVVLNSAGQPLGGVNIAVCNATATIGTGTTPCSPLASIYTDATLTTTAPNPLTTDGLGNYGFWAPPGTYQVQIYGLGAATTMKPVVLACVLASSCAFSQLNNIIFVDGVTYPKNSTGITAAINALPGGPGTGVVYLPTGTYTLTAAVNNRTNTRILCADGAILTQANGANLANFIVHFGVDNGYVENCTIDGNRSGNTDNFGGVSLISLSGSTNVTLKGTRIRNSSGICVYTGTGTTPTITNNQFSNCPAGSVQGGFTGSTVATNGTFTDNTMTGIANLVFSFSDGNTVSRNKITGYGQASNVTTAGTAVTWVSGATFTNISPGMYICIGGTEYLISAVGSSTSLTLSSSAGTQTNQLAYLGTADSLNFANSSNNTITGNVISKAEGYGIVLFQNGSGEAVLHNTITGNVVTLTGGDCVALNSSGASPLLAGTAVVGNAISDCGQGGTAKGSNNREGIELNGTDTSFTSIVGNSIYDDQMSPTTLYGIINQTSTPVQSLGPNSISGMATASIGGLFAPSISSGFGSSPSIAQQNGSAAFEVNVGTGGSATSGVIGLPAATNGWSCTAVDMNTNIVTRETAFTTTTVTLTAASAWTASDKLLVNCGAF